MRSRRLLIIGHDEEVLLEVAATLRREGYQVTTAVSGEEGMARAAEFRPDLILLDVNLPGPGAIELCRAFRSRSRTCRAAIILMTTLEREPEILAVLENGADDYVIKPFLHDRAVVRCRIALERRSGGIAPQPVVHVHELVIDPNAFEARAAGKRLDLTPTELRLLYTLASRPGWVFTRYQIVDAVRGEDSVVRDRAVDEQILGLRRKLGPYGAYVETVRGVGYRFRAVQFD